MSIFSEIAKSAAAVGRMNLPLRSDADKHVPRLRSAVTLSEESGADIMASELNLEKFTTGTGQEIFVHRRADCHAPCPVHAPSEHALVSAPTYWRADRRIFERICAHGVGHPDPDSTASEDSIHGCDGCCA